MSGTLNSDQRLSIGIVGGSIAGCAAAVALMRAGHRVTVFERSPGALVGRGAGIGAQQSVLRSLVERDLIDADMPRFHAESFPHVGTTTACERLGHTAWNVPITMELLNWGDLYSNLRKRVPEGVYHGGHEVVDARMADEETVVVHLADGREEAFDLVVFADGYRSVGRQLLFPEAELQYRGYVLWRGILEERDLENGDPLEGTMRRVGYGEGYGAFYFVPGHAGSVAKGERWVNWACYTPLPAEDLADFLVDRTGRRRSHSLPPGSVRPEEEARIKRLARDAFPPYFGEIVNATRNTFVQPIFTAEVPVYHEGRICLIGDALETWSMEQTRTGERMVALARQLEEALIWSIPDFSRMDEAAMRSWWQDAATLPEEIAPSSEKQEAGQIGR